MEESVSYPHLSVTSVSKWKLNSIKQRLDEKLLELDTLESTIVPGILMESESKHYLHSIGYEPISSLFPNIPDEAIAYSIEDNRINYLGFFSNN